MTVRGACLLIPAVLGSLAGLLLRNEPLSLLSLAVVLWIGLEWLLFRIRLIRELPQLRLVRSINGRADESFVCFTDRRLQVSLTLTCHGGRVAAWTRVREFLPDHLTVPSGTAMALTVRSVSQLSFTYECRAPGAGLLVLPGCRVRIQDANGFFWAETFVECRQTIRVLPQYDSASEFHPRIKRLNGLPQHGLHRLQSAGIGSELLELREYIPGDSPRTIAWKASARRNQLMTRQYESEVPMRTMLFCEDTARTRVGQRGQRVCDAVARLAASVAHASLNAGDPAGLVLFSQAEVQRFSPGWGDRTLFRILEQLATLCRHEQSEVPWSLSLQQQALEICQERYPHLLDPTVNRIPWTLFPVIPWNRRRADARSRLAGVLTQVHGLSVADYMRLQHDNRFAAGQVQRLLSDSGRVAVGGADDPSGLTSVSSAADGTLSCLADSIRRCVSCAQDNENYVIICQLLKSDEVLEILKPVIQLARARHHRVGVVFLQPAVPGISGNGNDPPSAAGLTHEAWQIALEDQKQQLRRTLRSLGASVSLAEPDRPATLVLSDLQLVRGGRSAGVLH